MLWRMGSESPEGLVCGWQRMGALEEVVRGWSHSEGDELVECPASDDHGW